MSAEPEIGVHRFSTGFERDVFVEPYTIEARGHVGSFWSDDHQWFSFCNCSCGWSNDTPSAEGMLDLWRRHYDAITCPSCDSPSPMVRLLVQRPCAHEWHVVEGSL